MSTVWGHLALAFSALLPLVNPIGSALIFFGLVGPKPPEVYRKLARSVAINLVLFFVTIEIVGSAILKFFGISLPIVQVAGGLVLAAMGWSLLRDDSAASDSASSSDEDVNQASQAGGTLEQKVFYPFTFPVTAGPGCIVVMLTLSAHASSRSFNDSLLAHVGIFLAVLILSGLVYFVYAYAPRLTQIIPPPVAHGVLRVVAFILLCIGAQIAWNGASTLLTTLLRS